MINARQVSHYSKRLSGHKASMLHHLLGEQSYKENWFFLDIFRKGGGSRRIQNFLNRKNSDFFGLFAERGGGSHPIQKGFSRKLGKISKKSHFFWIFRQKLVFFLKFLDALASLKPILFSKGSRRIRKTGFFLDIFS